MIGNIPLDQMRRCKHCGDIVVGEHADRQAHRAQCKARQGTPAAGGGVGAGNDATTANAPSQSQGSAAPAAKQPAATGAAAPASFPVRCMCCGRRRDDATHDGAECDRRLQVRAATSLDGAIPSTDPISGKPASKPRKPLLLKDRLAITPDIGDFDQKLSKLAGKMLPPIQPLAMAKWAACNLCHKRMPRDRLKQHLAASCIVGVVLAKVDWLEAMAGLPSAQDLLPSAQNEASSSPASATPPSPLPLAHNTAAAAAGSGQKGQGGGGSGSGGAVASLLACLPRTHRLEEELRLVTAIIHAVVPLHDLVPGLTGGVASSSSRGVPPPDPRPVLLHLGEVRRRVEAWVAAAQQQQFAGGPSIVASASPGSAPSSSSGAQPVLARMTLENVLHGLPTTDPTLFGRKGFFPEHKKKHRTVANGGEHATTGSSSSSSNKAASSAAATVAPPRFDQETLALANAIVNGDLSFDEALHAEHRRIPSQIAKAKSKKSAEEQAQLEKWLRRQ